MTADESNIYYHAWNTVPGVSMRRLGSLLCRFGNAKTAWQNAKSTDLRMLSIKQENIEIFLERVNETFDPIYKQIYNLGHQNRLLKEARDILLKQIDILKLSGVRK